jgi:hypothetical protein
LNTWSRSQYQELPLQQLHYLVIFGNIDESLPPLDSIRYRSAGLPEGIELEFASREESPELWDQFQKGPAWVLFCESAPTIVDAITSSPTCVIARGQIADSDNLEPLGNIIGIITSLLDSGGIVVYDVLTATWFDSLNWKMSVFEPCLEGLAKLVLVQQEAENQDESWIYTRGMRRFARPDVSFRNVPNDAIAEAELLVEFLTYSMMDGAVIPNGKELIFKDLPPTLSGGSPVKILCNLEGSLDDPHFFNFFLQIAIVSSLPEASTSDGTPSS